MVQIFKLNKKRKAENSSAPRSPHHICFNTYNGDTLLTPKQTKTFLDEKIVKLKNFISTSEDEAILEIKESEVSVLLTELKLCNTYLEKEKVRAKRQRTHKKNTNILQKSPTDLTQEFVTLQRKVQDLQSNLDMWWSHESQFLSSSSSSDSSSSQAFSSSSTSVGRVIDSPAMPSHIWNSVKSFFW
jgi:hypothetical protein